MAEDRESNRFSARARRYVQVGTQMGGVAARMAGSKLLGKKPSQLPGNALALAATLGGLKGPLMKVAQLAATVPDLLPSEFAEQLQQLQSQAPPMGAAFVQRRMHTELGPDWQKKFTKFDLRPIAAASLGQVHRAQSLSGQALACKLQYPDMASAVEADLKQLDWLFSMRRFFDGVIDTREIVKEIGARLREELDYELEAKHLHLYREIFRDDLLAGKTAVKIPGVLDDLSTRRLLTMEWMEGAPLLSFVKAPQAQRNRLGAALFRAWWLPFSHFGVIHGDPHPGNYGAFSLQDEPHGINLLDFGCIRIFNPKFVGGVVELYHGLRQNDLDRVVNAYKVWGFPNLTPQLIETLNVWARFIYGPLLDDRERSIADGVAPGQYGRREAYAVHQQLKKNGPVLVPREFVFMDRAAIGLGSVFLHLDVRMNFYQAFNELLQGFDLEKLRQRQTEALQSADLPLPD